MSNISNAQMLDGDAGGSDVVGGGGRTETRRYYVGQFKNRVLVIEYSDGTKEEIADPVDGPPPEQGGGGGGGGGKTVVSRVQQGSGRSRVVVITYSDGTTETLADPNIDEEETGRSYRGTGKNRIRITTWTDGTFTEEADPEADPFDDATNNDDREEDASTRTFVGEGKNRKRRSLWRNGTQEEWRTEDAPTVTGGTGTVTGGTTTVDPVPGGTRKDALLTIEEVLATYGLGGLAQTLYDLYLTGAVNISNPDAIIYAIRNEKIYKDRFAANALRSDPNRKGGPLMELDPASYIELENSYRRLMQSNGLPLGFYDQTSDFTALLAGDVSAAELQDRVQNGFRAVQDADPEVKREMERLYGVSEGDLAAYFLDPEKAAPILTRNAKAAKIAARAREQAGMLIDVGAAEEIASRGITAEEAQQGFTKLGLEKGLYTGMTGEQSLNQAQQIGAALGYDVDAQKVLAQRKQGRKAVFAGGGSFTKTTGATSGTTESGLNVAQ